MMPLLNTFCTANKTSILKFYFIGCAVCDMQARTYIKKRYLFEKNSNKDSGFLYWNILSDPGIFFQLIHSSFPKSFMTCNLSKSSVLLQKDDSTLLFSFHCRYLGISFDVTRKIKYCAFICVCIYKNIFRAKVNYSFILMIQMLMPAGKEK